MSEVPETRLEARAAGAKDDAWGAVREAQSAWAGAMRSHELAPPDAGFRDRLRAFSEAADAMRDDACAGARGWACLASGRGL